MAETNSELERLKEESALKDEEITVLKAAVSEKDEESQKRQSMLEEKLSELERLRACMCAEKLYYTCPKSSELSSYLIKFIVQVAST